MCMCVMCMCMCVMCMCVCMCVMWVGGWVYVHVCDVYVHVCDVYVCVYVCDVYMHVCDVYVYMHVCDMYVHVCDVCVCVMCMCMCVIGRWESVHTTQCRGFVTNGSNHWILLNLSRSVKTNTMVYHGYTRSYLRQPVIASPVIQQRMEELRTDT